MNYICLWGILASITGIAIMFSVIKHKKSVSAYIKGNQQSFLGGCNLNCVKACS